MDADNKCRFSSCKQQSCSCKFGYHLNDSTNQCSQNICQCPNGVVGKVTQDSICIVHEGTSCQSCDSNYHLASTVCVENPDLNPQSLFSRLAGQEILNGDRQKIT